MLGAFEGLDDEAEQHAVEFSPEGADGDVAEAKAGEHGEPLLQPLLRGVDGCSVVVVGSGALDAGVEVVAGGVEGVQDSVPTLVRGPVIGDGAAVGEGGDDGAEELPALPEADGVGAVVGFVADGDDLGDCHARESSDRVRQRSFAMRLILLTKVLTPSLDAGGHLWKAIKCEASLSSLF